MLNSNPTSNDGDKTRKRCDLIIDGNALFGISYFSAYRELGKSYEDPYFDPDGNPASAIVSAVRRILRLISSRDYVIFVPEKILICFDGKPKNDKKRIEKPLGYYDELDRFKQTMREFFGASVFTAEAEADDAVASALRWQTDSYMCLVSTDKDLFQMIKSGVFYFDLRKKRVIEEREFLEKYPCKRAKFLPLYLALCGDSIDKISGVWRVGKSKAKKMLADIPDDVTLREAIHLISQRLEGKRKTEFYASVMLTTLFEDEEVPKPKPIILPPVRRLSRMGFGMLTRYVGQAKEALNWEDGETAAAGTIVK